MENNKFLYLKFIEKNRLKLWLLFSFLVAFVPRFIVSITAIPIKNVSDDVALLSVPAFFAGKDWSAVISNAGYYGFGFYGFFFWFYFFNLTPVILFRLFAVLGAFLQAFSTLICFYILHKYLKVDNFFACFGMSLICTYMTASRSGIVTNEHPLMLLSWMVAFLLCKLVYEQKKRTFNFILLCILMTYGFLLHTRSIVIFLAVILGFVSWAWIFRKNGQLVLTAKNLIICVLFLLFGYNITKIGINFVQSQLWNYIDKIDEGLRNASYSVPLPKVGSAGDIFGAWKDIVFGQIITINIFSGGLAIFLLLFIIRFLMGVFNGKEEQKASFSQCVTLLALVYLFAIGGTIFAQSLSWLSGVSEGYLSNNWSNVYAFKALGYLRYFMPYVGPLMMAGFAIVYQWERKIRTFILPSMGISCIGIFYWYLRIFPKLADNPQGFTTGLAALGAVKQYSDVNSLNYYLMIFFFLNLILALSWLLRKKKYRIVLTLLSCVCIFEYYWQVYYQDRLVSIDDNLMVNSSYELISAMETEYGDIFQEIYVYDATDRTDHQSFYMYQFYLPDTKVLPYLPEQECENVVLFCNKDIHEILSGDYQYARLDDNEYIYVKGKEYAALVSQYTKLEDK